MSNLTIILIVKFWKNVYCSIQDFRTYVVRYIVTYLFVIEVPYDMYNFFVTSEYGTVRYRTWYLFLAIHKSSVFTSVH